LIFNYLY